MPKRKTDREFQDDLYRVWHNTLITMAPYVRSYIKMPFRCQVCHTLFSARPHDILRGHGCPLCGLNRTKSKQRKSNEDFKKELFNVSNGEIQALEPYPSNNKGKIKVKCSHGHVWKSSPNELLRGFKCPTCAGLATKKRLTYSLEKAKKVLYSVVGGNYLLIDTTYISFTERCLLQCVHCGRFINVSLVQVKNHNCSLCDHKLNHGSYGENVIDEYLTKIGVVHSFQKDIGCYDKAILPYDFYLPKYHLIIEYDGKQHIFNPEKWGGDKMLSYIKRHDSIKNQYALDNGYSIYRIEWRFRTQNQIIQAIDLILKMVKVLKNKGVYISRKSHSSNIIVKELVT